MKNTTAATEAVMKAKDVRIAERLQSRGWVCFSPEALKRFGAVVAPAVLVEATDVPGDRDV